MKPKELLRLTLRNYLYLVEGYNRSDKEKWFFRRELLAFIHNSGFNIKKAIKGSELMPFEGEKEEQSLEEIVRMLK